MIWSRACASSTLGSFEKTGLPGGRCDSGRSGLLPATVALFALLPLLLVGIGRGQAVSEDQQVEYSVPIYVGEPADLVVFFTGNIVGTVTRSSCSDPQLGGFARRATFLRENLPTDVNAILVDAGNLFDCNSAVGRLKARLVVKGLDAMGYDAVALGPKDFIFGLETLQSFGNSASFDFICANVVQAESLEPVFASHILKGTASTILVSAVISPRYSRTIVDWTRDEGGQQTVQVIDPKVAVAKVLGLYGSEARGIVLLAQMSLEEAKSLAQQFPMINLIIVSDRNSPGDIVYGETVIANAGTKGKYVRCASIRLDDALRVADYTVQGFPIQVEIEPSSRLVRLYEAFLARRARLLPKALAQPDFALPEAIFEEPDSSGVLPPVQ